MLRSAKYLLILFAVLAVGTAQVFGIGRGFLCDCSGKPVHADSAVCESSACHPGGGHHNHSHDHDCPEDEQEEHQHKHQAASESFTLVAPAPLTYDLPLVATYDISEVLSRCLLLSREAAEHDAEWRPPDDTGGNPPAAILVAQTVVMLV